QLHKFAEDFAFVFFINTNTCILHVYKNSVVFLLIANFYFAFIGRKLYGIAQKIVQYLLYFLVISLYFKKIFCGFLQINMFFICKRADNINNLVHGCLKIIF